MKLEPETYYLKAGTTQPRWPVSLAAMPLSWAPKKRASWLVGNISGYVSKAGEMLPLCCFGIPSRRHKRKQILANPRPVWSRAKADQALSSEILRCAQDDSKADDGAKDRTVHLTLALGSSRIDVGASTDTPAFRRWPHPVLLFVRESDSTLLRPDSDATVLRCGRRRSRLLLSAFAEASSGRFAEWFFQFPWRLHRARLPPYTDIRSEPAGPARPCCAGGLPPEAACRGGSFP